MVRKYTRETEMSYGDEVVKNAVSVQTPGGKTENSISEKPPLGIMPYRVWRSQRAEALLEAMLRYVRAGKTVPHEWRAELESQLAGPPEEA